jgi:fatty-acyl-CoA synthase
MSETCPLLTLAQLTPDMLAADLDAQAEFRTRTGQAVPLVDLRVVDDELRDVAHDGAATGEVVVRAPWLTQGYALDPASSEALWRGGYLHTADLGNIGPSGCVQVTDRIKDVIKSGGEWISSLDIEDILSRHPSVGEAAVIGMPDEKWGERPLALIVLKPGYEPSPTEACLQAHVKAFADRGMISRWAVPSSVRFVEAIDKTSVGKLDKKALRQKYASPTQRGARA